MQMPLVLKLSEGLDIFCPLFADKKTHQTPSAELYVDDRMYVCGYIVPFLILKSKQRSFNALHWVKRNEIKEMYKLT